MNQYKHSLLILVWLLPLAMACSSGNKGEVTAQTNAFKPYEWLLGSWQMAQPQRGRVLYETWQRQAHDVFTATAFAVNQQGDTTSVERLMLRRFVDGIYLTAEVAHNNKPIEFKLTSTNNQHLVFENPRHDFPKTITYQRVGPNKILATAIGDNNKIEYKYNRQQ